MHQCVADVSRNGLLVTTSEAYFTRFNHLGNGKKEWKTNHIKNEMIASHIYGTSSSIPKRVCKLLHVKTVRRAIW